MRNRNIKTAKDIYSLAVKIENSEVDKIELEIRLDSLNSIVTQFRQEDDLIVDSLIILEKVEEFYEFNAPITASMDNIYFESRRIVSCVVAKKMYSLQTSSSLPKTELTKFDGNARIQVFQKKNFNFNFHIST